MAKLRPRFELSQYACVCVCACYLRQLQTQLRAGGPWHQCGSPETRYWRRVQRVLNPGLLEGSLYFSHSSLSLSPLLTSVTKRMQSFLLDRVSVWKTVWQAFFFFFPELDQVPEMQHVAKLVLPSSLNSLIHAFYNSFHYIKKKKRKSKLIQWLGLLGWNGSWKGVGLCV